MAKSGPEFPEVPDHPHLKEFREFTPQADKESARGELLMSIAYLDELLRRILLVFFVDDPQHEELMEDAMGPVASFSSRIKLCGALGLLRQKEVDELHRLPKIRNRFSHEIHVSFDDQQIKDWCKNLTYKAHDYKHPTMGEIVVPPRGQFTTSTHSLILNLVNRAHYVRQRRCVARDWPY